MKATIQFFSGQGTSSKSNGKQKILKCGLGNTLTDPQQSLVSFEYEDGKRDILFSGKPMAKTLQGGYHVQVIGDVANPEAVLKGSLRVSPPRGSQKQREITVKVQGNLKAKWQFKTKESSGFELIDIQDITSRSDNPNAKKLDFDSWEDLPSNSIVEEEVKQRILESLFLMSQAIEVDEKTPDYSELVQEYLEHGSAYLNLRVQEWVKDNDPFHLAYQLGSDGTVLPNLDRVNQISETVFEMASKESNTLASYDPKQARFQLGLAFEPMDYGNYPPVAQNPELAREAMRLLNTGFFDKHITTLINDKNDAVKTLRNHAVLTYMGTNEFYEIIDAACCLVQIKPFKVVKYVGEPRHSLDSLLRSQFKPLENKIQDFRVNQKRADKFPCLTILCLIENKVTNAICEFRRHYTAQGGGQLVIPGFSKEQQGVVFARPPLDILGQPRNIPVIRGLEEEH